MDNYTKDTRENAIDRLVLDEIDTIKQMVLEDDFTYIDSIVRDGGIAGIRNLTNEELMEEYYIKFDEYLKII